MFYNIFSPCRSQYHGLREQTVSRHHSPEISNVDGMGKLAENGERDGVILPMHSLITPLKSLTHENPSNKKI